MNLIGTLGEKAARVYLMRNNYRILEYNFRTTMSEVDIIAEKNQIVHFVEVKANAARQHTAGEFRPEYRVDEKKIRKILLSAHAYWNQHYVQQGYTSWQIDVIGVIVNTSTQKAHVTYWPNVAGDSL